MDKLFQQPFGVLWRSALMKGQRLVPLDVLRLTNPKGPLPFVINLQSHSRHLIPLHTYVPDDLDLEAFASHQAADGKPPRLTLPVIIDFHGGGFFMGSCLEQAPFCAKLCRDLGAVVMTVDYRMGPVDKFPTANEDAEDTVFAILDAQRPGYVQLRVEIKQHIIEVWKDRQLKARSKADKHDKHKKSKDRQQEITVPPSVAKLEVDLDVSKIAISGFSSGANLALNLAINVPEHSDEQSTLAIQTAQLPKLKHAWPCPFPQAWPAQIPLLLFYPSLDARQLPSERTKPPDMPIPNQFWESTNDILMPTYLPRNQAAHLRASPGLANMATDLHSRARIFLVLSEMDNLAEQSEVWVEKVQREGRGRDLRVDRFKGMKHGWTQIPWLKKEEEKCRDASFDGSVGFVKGCWENRGERDFGRESTRWPVEAQGHEVAW